MNSQPVDQGSALVADLADYRPAPVPALARSSTALVMDDAAMDKMLRLAEVMASGRSTIPKHLQGNVGDCMAIVMQAMQWRMNPYAVAQKTHTVNGTLGYEAQLVAAVINDSGLVKDRFNFEWFGAWEKIVGKFVEKESKRNPGEKYRAPGWNISDEVGLGIKVWATIKGEAEPRVLELLLLQAGVRNSTLWADDPKQQLAYLAQKRWARLHAPDVILGVYTKDELEDSAPRTTHMGAADVVVPPIPEDLLKAARLAASQGKDAFAAWWKKALPTERSALRPEVDNLKVLTDEAEAKRVVDVPHKTAAAPATAAKSATESVAADKPAITYAKVMERLNSASDIDALDIAADLIQHVADEGQRVELSTKYEAMRKEKQQ